MLTWGRRCEDLGGAWACECLQCGRPWGRAGGCVRTRMASLDVRVKCGEVLGGICGRVWVCMFV